MPHCVHKAALYRGTVSSHLNIVWASQGNASLRHRLICASFELLKPLQGLPKHLLEYCRFAHCIDKDSLDKAAKFDGDIINIGNEITVLKQLQDTIKAKLAR